MFPPPILLDQRRILGEPLWRVPRSADVLYRFNQDVIDKELFFCSYVQECWIVIHYVFSSSEISAKTDVTKSAVAR